VLRNLKRKNKQSDTYNLPIPTVFINMIHRHKRDFRLIKEAIEGCPSMVQKLRNINLGNLLKPDFL